MTTINFNVPLKGLDGKEAKDKNLSQVLSEILGQQSEGKTLKLYGWYKTLQVGDPLQLDDADKKDLEKLIDEHKTMFIFVKGQLLEIISNAK